MINPSMMKSSQFQTRLGESLDEDALIEYNPNNQGNPDLLVEHMPLSNPEDMNQYQR
jgi:hypothetical protein